MTTPEIMLDPMTEEEYAAWLGPIVQSYAMEYAKTGRLALEQAVERAEKAIAQTMPDGPRSEGKYVYTVREAATGDGVGALWVQLRPRGDHTELFVLSIDIDAPHRGKGFGRAAMTACGRRAVELGAKTVTLHVFGDNTAARALYASLGYRETDVTMSLTL